MSRHYRKSLLVAAACTSLTACATIMNGSNQRVLIESTPSGAPVRIDGVSAGVTPLRTNVARKSSHHVSIGADSGARTSYILTRHASAWLVADLAIFYPLIVVDIVTGGAFVLKPRAFRAQLPATLAVAAIAEPIATTAAADSARAPVDPPAVVAPKPPPTWLGLSAGHRLRFAKPGESQLAEATLDSVAGDRLYWRPASDRAYGASQQVLPLSDVSHLQVRRPAERSAAGASMVRHGSQLAWVVPMVAFASIGSQARGFKAGAIASAAVIPVAFILGAGGAENGWAPIEAQRSGSPLLVDDRVRVRSVGSGDVVSGRLVDMDAKHLVIRAGADTFRVMRSNVQSVARAEGFNMLGRATYGAAVGVMMGFLNLSTCACRVSQADMYTVPLSNALVGLLAAPALAPRRWRSVTSW